MSELHDIEARYNFSEPEILKIGRTIARLSQDLQNKEDEKKEVVAGFKHELDAIKNDQSHAVNCVNNGFEMRIMTTRMRKNYATNEREFYSLNGDLVHTEDFKKSDYQRDIKDDLPESDGVEVGQQADLFGDQEQITYQQLLYSQSLQSFFVEQPGAAVEQRPTGDDWAVLVMPTYPEVIEGFMKQHPDLGGSFLTVKTAFESYLKEFFSLKRAGQPGDSEDEGDIDEEFTGQSKPDEPINPTGSGSDSTSPDEPKKKKPGITFLKRNGEPVDAE